MHLLITVEWEDRYVVGMIRWCRDNRVPLVQYWIEPIWHIHGDHLGDCNHFLGTRPQAQPYRPFDSHEIMPYCFLIRERDYILWKLRSQIPNDKMSVDNSELYN